MIRKPKSKKGKAKAKHPQPWQEKDIQVLKAWKDMPPRLPPPPRGPTPGALFTNREMVFAALTQSTSVNFGNNGNAISQTGSTAVLGQMSFCLADLNSVSSYGSLFDRYRMEKVHVRITSRNTAPSVFLSGSTNDVVPTVFLAIDRDDSSAPSAISDLTQYDNCIELPGWMSCDVVLVPSVVSTIANASSTATSSVIEKSNEVWLDLAATTIPTYGIKFGVTALAATSTARWVWDVELWYTVSFKNTR